MQTPFIAPSILSADFSRLGEEVHAVLNAGADLIHFDVMDNHYVPNLTIGACVLASLRRAGINAEMDVHLMIQPVDTLIPAFAKAGASYMSFHPEATANVAKTISLIREHGVKPGIALNPDTPLEIIKPYLADLDLLLLMSVNPGFGGQSFIPSVLDKAKRAREWIDASHKPIRLEMDGGINLQTIKQVAESGIDTFVAGSAIFHAANYAETIHAMKSLIQTGYQKK